MKTKKTLSLALVMVMIISLFAGCGAQQTADLKQTLSSDAVLSEIYPADGTEVNLHTKKQASYLEKSVSLMPVSANGKKELSKPENVILNWIYDGDEIVDKYFVSLSTNEDMSYSTVFEVSTNSLVLTNLKIATKYYWSVNVNGVDSSVYSFTTSGDTPRNINVDGVKNVRDLGGRETEKGTRTKQGLIYRCGRLNESSVDEINVEITEEGRNVMLTGLGIKSEIDLRKINNNEVGSITESPLGESVAYYSCPMEWEGDTFNGNKEQLLSVFEILADENNYPLIFHCNIGTDRTGMIAYLVNALLGVPEEELVRDYMFSNLADIGGTRSAQNLENSVYHKSVAEAEGDTLSEKAYKCLSDFGVPTEQLDKIIEILG